MRPRWLIWPWLAAARLVQRVERQWFEDAGLTWSETDAPRDAATLPRFEESVHYWPRRAGAEQERVIAIYHGHDASIAVSVGGEVRCVLELERLFGVRFYRLPDEGEDLRAFRDDLTAALSVVKDRCLDGGSTRFHLAVLQAPLRFLPRVLHDAGFVVERYDAYHGTRANGTLEVFARLNYDLGQFYTFFASLIPEVSGVSTAVTCEKLAKGAVAETPQGWHPTMYLGWAGKLMGYAAAGKPTPELQRACRAVWELSGRLSAQTATFGAQNLGTGDWVAHKTTGAPSQENVVPLERAIVDAVCKDGVEGQRALAAAVQLEFERLSVEVALALVDAAEARDVVVDGVALTGGCALNVLANQRLADALQRRTRPLDIYVPPAPNDSGQALGMLWAARPPAGFPGSLQYAGFDLWDRDDVEAAAAARGAERLAGVEQLAAILAGGDICAADTCVTRRPIVAIVRGRQEFGPRALGHRSLVAVPDSDEVRERMNRLKHRQWYRPTAPVVAAEAMDDLFGRNVSSPYMSMAPRVRDAARAKYPALGHLDGTARHQSVDTSDEPWLHALLLAVGRLTGIAALINTSFNTRGKPICNTVKEALAMLEDLPDLDYVLIGDWLFRRQVAPEG